MPLDCVLLKTPFGIVDQLIVYAGFGGLKINPRLNAFKEFVHVDWVVVGAEVTGSGIGVKGIKLVETVVACPNAP